MLVIFLICLFLGLSFNAYACLVPIFEDSQATERTDCAKPGKEPVAQFCDGFKTLAVQSGPDTPSPTFSHVDLPWDLSFPGLPDLHTTEFIFSSQKGELLFPKNRLPLLSVFRN